MSKKVHKFTHKYTLLTGVQTGQVMHMYSHKSKTLEAHTLSSVLITFNRRKGRRHSILPSYWLTGRLCTSWTSWLRTGQSALWQHCDLISECVLHLWACIFVSSSNVDMQTCSGNTALHYSCLHNKSDCVRLLLRARASTQISRARTHTTHTYTLAPAVLIRCESSVPYKTGFLLLLTFWYQDLSQSNKNF